jgi:uncharacterized protein involved in outer membrane biogenesis
MHPILRRVLTGKYFLFSVAALLFYTLLGFFALPYTIGWYAPKLAHDRLNCQVNIGKIRINPFLMSVEVTDFSLTAPDGSSLAGFGRLYFDIEPSGVFSRTVRFSEFYLDRPNIQLVFEPDGETNFTKLVPKSPKPEPEPKPSSSPESVRLLLQVVAITGGKVTVTDNRPSVPETIAFQDFNLNVKALSTIRDQSGSFSLSTTTQKGETFQWQGEIGLAPFRSSGQLACLNIQAATLWGFMRDNLHLESPAGKIDVSTQYHIDTGSTPLQLSLENLKVGLSGLSLKLAETEGPFFELSKLDVDSVRLDLAAKSIQVGKILADSGMLRLHVDDNGISNLQKIQVKAPVADRTQAPPASQEPPPQPSSPPDATPWTAGLEAIEIKNIGFDFVDMSRALPLTAGVSSISVGASAEIRTGTQIDVAMKGIYTELKGIHLGNRDGADSVFEAQRFFVQGGEMSLGARTVFIDRVGLSDGRLKVSRERDGKLNLETLFALKNPVPADKKPQSAPGDKASSWQYTVKDFELSGFHSALFDRGANDRQPLYQIQGLRVGITDIDGHSPMGVKLGFDVAQGGKVMLQGRIDPAAPSVDATIKVADLPLSPLQPYLEPYITLALQSAFVSTEGTFQYGVPKSGSKIVYDGSFSLDKLSLSNPGSTETFLGWAALQVPNIKLYVAPNNLLIEEVKLKKLLGQLIIAEDQTVNLSKILKPKPTKQALSPALPPEPPKKGTSSGNAAPKAPIQEQGEQSGDSFPFRIGKVRVEDGNVVFADLSLKPKFMTRIHSLRGMVSGLASSGDSLAGIELDGGVDQYGAVRVMGTLDFQNIKRSSDISLVFKNIELTSITPYSGKFAGRRIKSGKLSMNLDYKIQNNQMKGDNKIIVDNLELGEHVNSPEAVNLPLDLAVALLKDASGKIDIGLPVSGDLNDPQFRLGPLIWKVFTNLITKAVTAPFRALGSLFGGASETFDAVVFDFGKAELQPPEKEKLKKLSDVLQQRPQLQLVVQGRYSPETDGLEFKQASVRHAVGLRSGEKFTPGDDPGPLDLGDATVRQAMEKLFEERFGTPALSELNRGVKEGTIKARPADLSTSKKGKTGKKSLFEKIVQGAKLYKLVPGVKSPEQSELLAAEIYARLVESEPVSEQALRQLAERRAESVVTELEKNDGLPPHRITTKDPESLENDEGLSVKLSLDARTSSP